MKSYFARDALLPSGWARDVRIDVDAQGNIQTVEANSKGGETLAGPVLPGMANLHSHAFQRAMAGLAETRGRPDDDFWSWRELMYRFLQRLTPESSRAVAAQLYIEMLKRGYTAVGEFHYVHRGSGEMLLAHLDAARDCGIALALLPSLYRWSGFDKRPLQPRQAPFDSSPEFILRLVSDARRQATPDLTVGAAPHSLRAVDPASLKELVHALPADAPIHIHAAEQTKEVDECLAALGRRPVQWLLENFALDGRWCLAHSTHMTPEETRDLARSGATVALCPTTEANLGDGLFPLPAYRAAGGRYGIGGDSHVSRDPAEELRWLEYAQRLAARRRNIVAADRTPAVGTTLWLEAARGSTALGRAMGALAPGLRADLVVLDAGHPELEGQSGDALANVLVFSGTTDLVRNVMVGGRWVVRDGHHASEQSALAGYRKALKQLIEFQ